MTKDLETGGVKQVSKHIFETIRTEVLKEQNKMWSIQERIFF